ncbi:MAG TPA: beta-ketoacyl-ACP reductase [Bacteroidota bacterium]|nr:beta-ketoacyl-ACP reductase [Bacteroidota bacterium]
MAERLNGRVALVTGGSLGIGRATVLALAREGADVAFTYLGTRHRSDEPQLVVDGVKKLGRKAMAVESDVSRYAEAVKVVESVCTAFGRLDILINNAGINRDGVLWKMTEEQWDAVIDVNLKGCFNYLRAVSPIFRAQKSGKIVNVSSINGMRGKFGQANYAASKAGIIGLTKSAARELGPSNVNVNAVAPGFVETDMTRALPEEIQKQALRETAMGKFATPEDVAEVIVFLTSDQARHVTGEVVRVDGGQYL